jgi:hypothetical protein
MRRQKLTHDEGVAVAAEYVLLLGVSLLIFAAVFVGFNSFANTASSDATSEAAYRVAVLVSERLSGAVESQSSVTEDIDLPERICGRSYLVYPSDSGGAVYVLVGRETYEAPVILPDDVKAGGFMVRVPGLHRIDYDYYSKTLMLT